MKEQMKFNNEQKEFNNNVLDFMKEQKEFNNNVLDFMKDQMKFNKDQKEFNNKQLEFNSFVINKLDNIEKDVNEMKNTSTMKKELSKN